MTGQVPPLVEMLDVSVRSRGERLLDGVTLSVQCGTIHVIVGPNGAGKSTLLGALLGRIPFDGRIVVNWRRDGRIGFVPQSFQVDPTLPVTVADFLALARQARPVCFGVTAATRRRIDGLLHEVGLDGFSARPLSVLSGGELRRVLLAHAIDPRPELLVLDEPAAGLDEAATRRFEQILFELRAAGTTVLLVSHDLPQVERLADCVTAIDRRVVDHGVPPDVLRRDAVRPGGPRAWEAP